MDYLRKRTLAQAEQIEQMHLERNIVQIELEEARRKQEEEVEAMCRERNRVQRELEEARQRVQELERQSSARRQEYREQQESRWTPPHREGYAARRSPQPGTRQSPQAPARRPFLAPLSIEQQSKSVSPMKEDNLHTVEDVVMVSPPQVSHQEEKKEATIRKRGPLPVGTDGWSLRTRDSLNAYREERARLLKHFQKGVQKRLN